MNKKVLVIFLICAFLLSACGPLLVSDKKTEMREVCVESHREFKGFVFIGGKLGYSWMPSAGAMPVAQYKTICDRYEEQEFFMIQLSKNTWQDVPESEYNLLSVGQEYRTGDK